MIVSSPGAKAPGEGAMEAFPSPVIGDFLFPNWHIGAIISDMFVKRWKWFAVEYVRRFLLLKIRFEGRPRPFATHIAV